MDLYSFCDNYFVGATKLTWLLKLLMICNYGGELHTIGCHTVLLTAYSFLAQTIKSNQSFEAAHYTCLPFLIGFISAALP